MAHPRILTHLSIILVGIFISGCKLISPDIPQPGITEPVIFDGISIRVNKAEIRNSYSTYYIMHYPVETDTFYAITASIDGFEDPRSTLTWGEENLKLINGNNVNHLAYAQWIVVGEDIQYKSGLLFTQVRQKAPFHSNFLLKQQSVHKQRKNQGKMEGK